LIHYGGGVTPFTPSQQPAQQSALHVVSTDDTVDVETGVARVSIGRRGRRLFTSFSIGGRQLLADNLEPQLIATAISSAQPFYGEVENAVVEESNPLRAVVRVDGRFVSNDGGALLSWTVRMHFFANHSYVKLLHTLINNTANASVLLSSLRLSVAWQLHPSPHLLLGSIDPTESRCGPRQQRDSKAHEMTSPGALLQLQPESHQVAGLAPGQQDVQRRDGNGFGWIHLSDPSIGITMKLVRPWQNSPVALSTDGLWVNLHLYPDLTQPGLNAMQATPLPGVELPQGIAKTHELVLHVGPPCGHFMAADRIAIGFEHPLLLALAPEHWAQTGVLGSFQVIDSDYWPFEAKMQSWFQVPTAIGFLGFGSQLGESTDDLSFGLARSLLLQYLRTNDQTLFWRAQALLVHAMDAGTCHSHSDHPDWIGGPYRPGQIGTSAPSIEHAWVDGLVDFYFLSGYSRAREVAESSADFCRRNAPYEWREALAGDGIGGFGALSQVGNALKVMGTFFAAFPQQRFLRSMEALVDLLEQWQDDQGRWRHPIGLHREGAEPALTASVLEGLAHYYEASGDGRAQRMATDGAMFLARHGRTPEGLFYQQQFPGNVPCTRSLALLPTLIETFERTAESELLDAGHRLFRWAVDGDRVMAAHLKDLIAFMPLLYRMNLLEDYTGQATEPERLHESWPPSAVAVDR